MLLDAVASLMGGKQAERKDKKKDGANKQDWQQHMTNYPVGLWYIMCAGAETTGTEIPETQINA